MITAAIGLDGLGVSARLLTLFTSVLLVLLPRELFCASCFFTLRITLCVRCTSLQLDLCDIL